MKWAGTDSQKWLKNLLRSLLQKSVLKHLQVPLYLIGKIMYICLCTPTTDQTVRAACKSVSSSEELKTKLSICQKCKRCSSEIDYIFKSESNSYMQN